MQKLAKESVNKNYLYYKPFIVGLSNFDENTINESTFFELLIIDEVYKQREEYMDRKVYYTEQITRKRNAST